MSDLEPLPLPEVKDIRWWWVKGRTKGSPKAPSEDQFDRWLAAHDAQVKAEAFEEGAGTVSRLYAGTDADERGRAWVAGVDAAARTLRALAEGGN